MHRHSRLDTELARQWHARSRQGREDPDQQDVLTQHDGVAPVVRFVRDRAGNNDQQQEQQAFVGDGPGGGDRGDGQPALGTGQAAKGPSAVEVPDWQQIEQIAEGPELIS